MSKKRKRIKVIKTITQKNGKGKVTFKKKVKTTTTITEE